MFDTTTHATVSATKSGPSMRKVHSAIAARIAMPSSARTCGDGEVPCCGKEGRPECEPGGHLEAVRCDDRRGEDEDRRRR